MSRLAERLVGPMTEYAPYFPRWVLTADPVMREAGITFPGVSLTAQMVVQNGPEEPRTIRSTRFDWTLPEARAFAETIIATVERVEQLVAEREKPTEIDPEALRQAERDARRKP